MDLRRSVLVRSEGGEMMRLVAVENGVAELLFFHDDGVIRRAFQPASALLSLEYMLSAKSWWPKTNNHDEAELAREEMQAKLSRKARARLAKKMKRDAKTKRKVRRAKATSKRLRKAAQV